MRNLWMVTAAAMLALGCGSSSGTKVSAAPATAGCAKGSGSCYSGSGLTKAHCEGDGGTFLSGGCPTADRVGDCEIADLITPGEAGDWVYYAPQWIVSTAVADCNGSGNWTATCATGGGASMTLSCTKSSSCWEISGSFNACQTQNLAAECTEMMGGTSAAAACGKTGTFAEYCSLDGTRVTGVPLPGATMREYYDANSGSWASKAAAQAFCTSSYEPTGSWTSPPAPRDAVRCVETNGCIEVDGTLTTQNKADIQTGCAAAGGTYAAAACSRSGILAGSCYHGDGWSLGGVTVPGATATAFYSSSVGWWISDAQNNCRAGNGAWE